MRTFDKTTGRPRRHWTRTPPALYAAALCATTVLAPSAAAFTGDYTTGTPDKAPWYVSLVITPPSQPNAICSGVLTTPRTVATAAHCLSHGTKATYTVYRDIPGRGVSQVATNPAVVSLPQASDLGRLYLPKAFAGSSPVPAIRSNSKNDVIGKTGYMYGTGVTPGGNAKKILRVTAATYEWNPVNVHTFAAVHKGEPNNAHACTGDSGGPLMVRRAKQGSQQEEFAMAGLMLSGPSYPDGTPSCPAKPADYRTNIGWTANKDSLFLAPPR